MTEERTPYLDTNSPLVRKMLPPSTSFDEEVLKFYDADIERRSFYFREENPQNKDRRPKELVQHLNPFADEPFDLSKLTYEGVRADYERWSEEERENGTKKGCSSIIGFPVAIAGGLLGYLGKIPLEVSVGMTAAGTILAAYGFSWTWDLKDKGTYAEFERLRDAARRADKYIKNNCSRAE